MIAFATLNRFPGYTFGNDGTVWSRRPKNGVGPLLTTWRRMECSVSESGYVYVNLLRHPYRLSRIILEAFVGPCPKELQACHNDGNKLNNALDNLRWDTIVNNMQDRELHGTSNKGERNSSAKLTEADVLEIRRLLDEGITQIRIAQRYKVTQVLVSRIKLRKSWGVVTRSYGLDDSFYPYLDDPANVPQVVEVPDGVL